MMGSNYKVASQAYPFPGGIAGKLGDRFEAKWAVKKLFEVILGDAESLQFEFIDPLNHGVEFRLFRNGRDEWFQAKKQNTSGKWTIRRLEQEGVLASALAKVAIPNNDLFFFVSESPAAELGQLAQRAANTKTFDEFECCLSTDERNGRLPALVNAWDTTKEEAWQYLKRICVLVESENSLDVDIRLLGGRVFSNSFDHFFPILREYLESNFNRELTTEIVRQEIIGAGMLTPRMPLDPTLPERIEYANQRYLASYNPFGTGDAVVARKEADEVIELLSAVNGPTIIILTGNAGSGKSGVVREVLNRLREVSDIHLVFRVDKHLGIDSASMLGQKLYERQENPIVTLKSLEPEGKAILLVDQIDAISEVSGRTGPIRDIIFELIRFVKASKGVRLVVVCRTYDLVNDRALFELEKEHLVKRIDIKPLDWSSEIVPLFQDRGIPVERISPSQRELLTLPLNLALFLEVLGSDASAIQFQSTTDLLDRLVEKKQRAIRDRGYPDFALMPALSELALVMSCDQSLDAPVSALDRFPNALDLLASENLIIHLNGQINFFHESLFDYAFARGFVAEKRKILDLLKEDEQHLFRRTQIRQILTMYRQIGPRRLYLSQLNNLLISPSVRYHLKDAVARWLGSLEEMTEDELDIVLGLDNLKQQMPPLVRMAIYPQAGLLPLLLRRGLIAEWLESSNDKRRDDALNFLRNAVSSFPAEVFLLVREWWQKDTTRGTKVIGWLSMLHAVKPTADQYNLTVDLIRAKTSKLFKKSGIYDRHSLSAWIKHDPAAAGEILKVWFESWYEVYPESHPFAREEQNDSDYYWLKKLQQKSSSAFLNAGIPAFGEAIKRINLTFDGNHWTDYTWQLRFDGNNFGSDLFLALLRRAFADFAKTEPDQATIFLKQIDPLSHPSALYLWLETITCSGNTLGSLLPSLLTSDQLFEAGTNGAQWRSFARAANAALPHLAQPERILVESRILNHWPELDLAKKIASGLAKGQPEQEPFWTRKSAIYDLNRNGYEQWCILKTIDSTYLSPYARRRVAELDRKFRGKSIAKPDKLEMRTVPPPIGADRAKFMSNRDWLIAFDTYSGERKSRRHEEEHFWHTGSRGLAEVLRQRAMEEPERFGSFFNELSSTVPPEYLNSILAGLAKGKTTTATLKSVILKAHSFPSYPCCEGICQIIQKHPLHIPVEAGHHSSLKPDSIPVGRRTAFRSEAGQHSGDSGHPI